MADDGSRTEGNWERGVIEKLALEALKEQRRARRWGIFFKLLAFAYVTLLVVALFDWGRVDGGRATSTPRWSRSPASSTRRATRARTT